MLSTKAIILSKSIFPTKIPLLSFRLILLNKLLEDGNTLFRKGRLTDAAYRYEYALRRLPRLRPTEAANAAASSTSEDIFAQLKTHLLLNLSRTKRKIGNFKEAETTASEVILCRPSCHEAWWARAKARADQDRLSEALSDLRQALKLAPNNMQLHAFSLQVKNQLEANQLSILESTRKDTSTEASIELEEDEICALVEKSNNENEEGQHQ